MKDNLFSPLHNSLKNETRMVLTTWFVWQHPHAKESTEINY